VVLGAGAAGLMTALVAAQRGVRVTVLEKASECRRAGVRLETRCGATGIERRGEGFVVATDTGAVEAGAVVVATGGLSIPSMGCDGVGYELAEQFGLPVLPRRAGLVPFRFSGTAAAARAGRGA